LVLYHGQSVRNISKPIRAETPNTMIFLTTTKDRYDKHTAYGYQVPHVLLMDTKYHTYCLWIPSTTRTVYGYQVPHVLFMDTKYQTYCLWIPSTKHTVYGYQVPHILFMDTKYHTYCLWIPSTKHTVYGYQAPHIRNRQYVKQATEKLPQARQNEC
jgi:hypothetical protein